jgi:ABC-type transport system substrate-binding protein
LTYARQLYNVKAISQFQTKFENFEPLVTGVIMKKHLLWPILLVFMLGTTFAAPKYGGTLVFGVGGDAVHMDPGAASDGNSINVTSNVYDNLLNFKYGTAILEPGLAESYNISSDGLTYTFKLRKGVKFHKTRFYKKANPFTADDVVFTLKRQMDSQHPFFNVSSSGKWVYWGAMDMNNMVESVKKIDTYTVQIKLQQVNVTFLSNLAMHFVSILSKTYAEDMMKKGNANKIDTYPVGTGPFKFMAHKRDDRVVLEANEAYWGGKPYLKRLILRVIPNGSVRAAELQTGAIQVLDFPSPSDIPILQEDPKFKLPNQEGLNVGYLALNMDKAPFDNVLVRKAMAYGINRQEIIDAVYEGFGKVAKNPIPPTMPAYNDDIMDFEYNPAKARELLAEAGYPNGLSSEIWAMPVARPYMPNARKVAEKIQADLDKVGIKLKIVSYEWGTYLSKTRDGEHPMCLLGWTGDNGDPDNFLFNLLGSAAAINKAGNRAFYKSAPFDAQLKLGQTVADPQKRIGYYRKAQEIFHNDVPWVPIAHSIIFQPMYKYVMGYKLNPLGLRQFKEVWLDK